MSVSRTLRRTASLAAILSLWAAGPIQGQERDSVVVVTTGGETEDDVDVPDLDEPVSPGGAFLRAVLIPGWGHASIGSYTRGGFYFAAEATTGWMLLRTQRRLSAARDARDLTESLARERLAERGITDPDSIARILDEDEVVDDARELVEARGQQREDWIALGIFLLFLGGADAFVSAHLADVPPPLEVDARPAGPSLSDGVTLQVKVPVGPPGRR